MAYIQSQSNEDEEENPATPGQSTGNAPLLSSAGSGQTGANKPQSFATLQSYLKANRPQGQQLASRLAQDVASTGQQAQQGIEQASQKATSDVQAQTLNYQPGFVSEALSSPTEFVKSPEKLAEFTKYRTANYSGPISSTEIPEYQKASADAERAMEKSRLTETEGGRKQLASQAQKSKAEGITALNQALLSTNPQAAATLAGSRSAFGNLKDLLSSKTAQTDEQIRAAQEAAVKARTDVASGLTPLIPALQSDLQKQQQAALAARDARNADIVAQKAWLDPLDAALRGYNQATGKAYANPLTDFRSRFSGDVQTEVPTVASTATPEQYAYESALEKLAGESLPFLTEEGLSALPDPNQFRSQAKISDIVRRISEEGQSDELLAELRQESEKPEAPNSRNILISPEAQKSAKQGVVNNYLRPMLMDELRKFQGANWTPRQEEYYKDKTADEILRSISNVWHDNAPGINRLSPEARNLIDKMVDAGVLKKTGTKEFPKYRVGV